ncbi:hypothetical protein BC832DRAFT_175043 [Gaertneriomyces semiglobifer]|nr:hypothetical protein BC832DRAFT_175043 [Gaertneriomyces semiglobifer]
MKLTRIRTNAAKKHSSLLHNVSEGWDRPRGLLVTCHVGSETRALGQIRAFLDKHLALLFPDNSPVCSSYPQGLQFDLKTVGLGNGANESIAVPEEISSRGEEEGGISEPMATVTKADSRFQAVDAACAGVLFIRFRVNVDPVVFVTKLFEYVLSLPSTERNDLKKSISYCSRLLPVTHTVHSALSDIAARCKELLPILLAQHAPPSTLSCVAEVRNKEGLKTKVLRDTVMSGIPGYGPDGVTSDWKVNLSDPKVVVFASVFKSICGLAVLPDYFKYRKYNFQMLGSNGSG